MQELFYSVESLLTQRARHLTNYLVLNALLMFAVTFCLMFNDHCLSWQAKFSTENVSFALVLCKLFQVLSIEISQGSEFIHLQSFARKNFSTSKFFLNDSNLQTFVS